MSVVGIVFEKESRKPLAGLRIRAYDKDWIRDDHLGDALTDGEGRFEIRFSEVQFRDFTETAPDVYIRIYDPSGKMLHSTETAVRRNAGVREFFGVSISKALLA